MTTSSSLTSFRTHIDTIDHNILRLLSERFECSRQIAHIKKNSDSPVFDAGREHLLFQKIQQTAKEMGLEADVAEAIFTEIVHQSRRVQGRVLR